MKTTKISAYEQQALDFLLKTDTTFKADFTEHGLHFDTDKEARDIYKITLTRKDKKPYTFRFGQSIVNSGLINANSKTSVSFEQSGRYMPLKESDFERKRKEPTAYDVLACLQKYDVGTFSDFCSEFGYDEDSRKAEKIYFAVQKEYDSLSRLYSEQELELMREIQ